MKITKALKAHAVEAGWCKAESTDDEVKAAVTAKLTSGDLTAEKFVELQTEAPAKGAKEIVSEAIEAQLSPLTKSVEALVAALAKQAEKPAEKAEKPAEKAPGTDGASLDGTLEARLAELVEKELSSLRSETDAVNPMKVFGGGREEPRIKKMSELYKTTKSVAIVPHTFKDGRRNPRGGMEATIQGRTLDTPSELDKAVSGAWFKYTLHRQAPHLIRLTERDAQLVAYAAHEMAWTGEISPDLPEIKERRLEPHEAKALLNEATSGGAEIVPVVFDEGVILQPVLFGELFPLVDLHTLPRGNNVEGASIANMTINSGPQESADTNITLETTSSFIAELNTTIFAATGGIELGLDFQEDTPVAIGAIVQQKAGEKFAEWLDNQIANGDGTTEPLGIFVASGTTAVNSAAGATGPMQVGDYEQLMFGVPKHTRNAPGATNVYISNDTMYRRARAIPVGETDARRIFGMNHGSYELMDHPYKVQNNIADGKVAFANMSYYRMWRRRGFTTRIETAGKTLALKNQMLILVRARFGGRPVLGSAFAIMADAATAG